MVVLQATVAPLLSLPPHMGRYKVPCGMQGNPAGCKYLTVRCSTSSSRGCGACAVQLTVPVYQHALCVVVVQHSINGVRCTTCTLLHVRVSYHVGGHNTTLRSVPFRVSICGYMYGLSVGTLWMRWCVVECPIITGTPFRA